MNDDKYLSNQIRNIDLNLLKIFHTIYLEQSITKAAQILCVSQPAVSNALKRLRELYNDPLFIRTPDGMKPSPKAQELSVPIQKALLHFGKTLSTEERFRPETSNRTFSVALTDYGEFFFLPTMLSRLSEIAQGVEIVCLPHPGATLSMELKAGTVDLVWDWVRIDDPEFHVEPVFDDPGYCLVRKNHPEIKGQLTLDQYLAAEHVALRPTRLHHPKIERTLERRGLKRKVVAEVSHLTVIPMVVARTNLIATMPKRLARLYGEMMNLQVIQNPVYDETVVVYQMWHDHFTNDHGHQWFRKFVKDAATQT